MIHHPLWLLVPWVVFAGAVGLKFWRLTSVFRRQQVRDAPSQTERFRQALERQWQGDQKTA